MTPIHRFLASLVPGRRGDWILAHGAEMDELHGRERLRWMAGLGPLFVRTVLAQLVDDPRSLLGSALARAAAVVLSPLLVIAGIALATAFFATDLGAIEVGLMAAVLVLQGGLVLLVVSGVAGASRRLVLAGCATAALIGLVGFAVGLGRNIAQENPDPEYAPMTIALLIGVHGLLSVIALTGTRDAATRS